ncbi:MAG: sensor histidine kinase [Nitrosopumilus sp.]|nr:sensor histidine kinase [Nitrosopumilus sp.]MDF2424026.1 sensor histidine kinase [Nitrosopumilus sp.]MDF2428572.1 sensor histidine kinase [Nitrosopumilus sp.]
MKINRKLVILFSAILVITMVITSLIAFQSVEATVIDSALQDMNSIVKFKEKEIQTLHSRASEDLVFAVKNPLFIQYFELPDTELGNVYDENDVKQFTPEQRKIKENLDNWIFDFQSKFSVDETCLIDSAGQEHTRLTFKEIAPDDDLSSEEAGAPFFEPSFLINKGEVHLQYPYVSPDSERWVFAYTTPIVKNDGTKPAFYHFEMPIVVFQELVDTNVGRMYVVDPNGFIIADSDDSSLANAKYNVAPDTITSFDPREYFPSIKSISMSSEYDEIFQNTITESEGFGTYSKNGELNYVAYAQLPTFGWILVYEKPYSLMLSGDTTLDNLGYTMGIVALAISAGGIVGIFTVSTRISNPIKNLAIQCNNQNPRDLKKVSVKTSDEVSDVSNAINVMIDQVNDLEKEKEELASMVTHELRTPLTPILGWCKTLKNPRIIGAELTEKQTNAVNAIIKNASRLQLMIGDILDVQKLDMGRVKLNNKEINLTEFVSMAYKDLYSVMEPKNIEFINTTKDDITITIDPNRLDQVLNNLILNAVDFVPEENGKIEIGAQDKDDSVYFYVKDNGIGITKDKQKGLFTRFYQVSTTQTRKHGGTGLGLSIAKGLVEAFGGKLWLDSDEGKGANFQFEIPKSPPKSGKFDGDKN